MLESYNEIGFIGLDRATLVRPYILDMRPSKPLSFSEWWLALLWRSGAGWLGKSATRVVHSLTGSVPSRCASFVFPADSHAAIGCQWQHAPIPFRDRASTLTAIRMLLVDDHVLFRKGLADLIVTQLGFARPETGRKRLTGLVRQGRTPPRWLSTCQVAAVSTPLPR
jgi:hypothetical protein